MKTPSRTITRLVSAALLCLAANIAHAQDGVWPVEKANAWLEQHGWLRGGNFTPSTAINQLEMWQADTFDEATIDRELGYAEALGLNSMRVFLHDLPWQQDAEGYSKRIERFLELADKHHIGVLFAIFDSCWHPIPKLGKQPDPIPFTHNSGWVQSPGTVALADPNEVPRLKAYVTGLVKRFANDKRIHGWDVWNEPDNGDGGEPARPGLEPKNKKDLVNALLPQVFAWAREAKPSQPLTSGVWLGDFSSDDKLSKVQHIQLENSDVISFHNYGKVEDLRKAVEGLRRYNRPILCTEFMARPNGSVFEPHLGYMKEQKVAAYCWGFVAGKTQTIFPWDSWKKKYTAEPPLWFHDILRPDGSPFRPEETAYIRRVTGVASADAGKANEPGTYRNPVLRGDYPDPSVIRVGDDYYATATSSEWGPQFPILYSKDLVNWEIRGTVFSKRPDWAEANFWAPEIQQWKDQYYIYYVGRKRGGPLALAVATAKNPEGPWTDHGPLVWQDAGSIDGMAIDDEKGQRWLVWKEDGNSRGKPTPIWAQQLDEAGTKLMGDRHEILRNDAPWEGSLIEGPFILRRGDWFYLFFAGNACCGRGCNYGTGVARSKSLLGPWEKNPKNPILATNADFRGPGHGSIVTDPKGRFWFLYHAYDIRSFIFTGREMMLDEVTFGADNWPEINGGKGASATAKSPTEAAQKRTELSFVDNFANTSLKPGWQWPMAHPPTVKCDSANDGEVVLSSGESPVSKDIAAAIARSCTTGSYTATTSLDTSKLASGSAAGISAFGDPGNAIGLAIRGTDAILWQVQKGKYTELTKAANVPAGALQLRMKTSDGRHFQYGYSTDGKTWTEVGQSVDGDFLPPWDRSVRVALVALSGEARFGSFWMEPNP